MKVIEMKTKTAPTWNKYQYIIEDTKTEAVLIDYVYDQSLVLAYDKVVKLVEVMNAKKDGHKWQVKCIENWPAS